MMATADLSIVRSGRVILTLDQLGDCTISITGGLVESITGSPGNVDDNGLDGGATSSDNGLPSTGGVRSSRCLLKRISFSGLPGTRKTIPEDSTSNPVIGISFWNLSPRVVAQSGRMIERLPPGSTVS